MQMIIIAFLIRVLVSLLLRMMFGLSSVGGGQTDINWLTDAPSLVFMKIAGGNFLEYVLAALVYFPITEFFEGGSHRQRSPEHVLFLYCFHCFPVCKEQNLGLFIIWISSVIVPFLSVYSTGDSFTL